MATVRRSPRNPLGNRPWTGPTPSLPGALTSAPDNARANRASEPVAAAEFSSDKVAVFAKSPAQRRDLNLEVRLRHDDTRPYTAKEFVFGEERPVGIQQDQEEIERARAQLYRHAVGPQLP